MHKEFLPGHWPITKIAFKMATSCLKAYPYVYSKLLYLRNTFSMFSNIVNYFSDNKRTLKNNNRKFDSVIGTRVDVMTE